MTPTPPRPTPASGISAAVLALTPPLAALAAWSVPKLTTLAQHPAAWLVGIGVAAAAITALAAAAETPPDDMERTAWPLLLAWPAAFPAYMNRRGRLATGLVGTLLLCGALAWSGWQIRQGHEAAAFLLQASGEEIDIQASGEQKISEAERLHSRQQRIDAMLDAEDAAR